MVEEARGSKLAIQKASGIASRFSSGGWWVSKLKVRLTISAKSTLSEVMSEILAEAVTQTTNPTI